MKGLLVALGALILGAATSPAQTASREQSSTAASGSPIPDSRPPGSELTVYLMTMGHGDEIWERFGHNAIRIVDAARGTDSVYNWGTFDFHQPNFLQRFMTGNTLYWMEGEGWPETLEKYRYLNRSVWQQELDLTPAERVAMRDFLAWNARPENRNYRYDYYLDNCSTRVRDVIDRIVGGQLKPVLVDRLTNTTYRFHTQRLFRLDRAVATGTNIGLGQVADRPISAWAESFLPTRFQEHVRTVQLKSADGSTRPLVKNEQQLFAAQRGPEPAEPARLVLLYCTIGLVVAAFIAVITRLAGEGRRGARVTLATLGTIWAALGGILGVILIAGWTATRHSFMAWNQNLLQFDPLSLALALVLPMAVLRGRAVRAAERLSVIVVVIALLGLVIRFIPGWHQVNGAVLALTLPIHLALAWSLRELAAYRDSPVPPGAAARAMVSRSAA